MCEQWLNHTFRYGSRRPEVCRQKVSYQAFQTRFLVTSCNLGLVFESSQGSSNIESLLPSIWENLPMKNESKSCLKWCSTYWRCTLNSLMARADGWIFTLWNSSCQLLKLATIIIQLSDICAIGSLHELGTQQIVPRLKWGINYRDASWIKSVGPQVKSTPQTLWNELMHVILFSTNIDIIMKLQKRGVLPARVSERLRPW